MEKGFTQKRRINPRKGHFLTKQGLDRENTASVLLKLFINGKDLCHTNEGPTT